MKIKNLAQTLVQPVKFVVLPGGRLPERHHVGDAAADCYTRAIVNPKSNGENMRETLWEFDKNISKKSLRVTSSIKFYGGRYYYKLYPGHSVSIGLGFNVQIPFGMAGFIYPRGSSIVKNGERIHLTVLNTNPIDHGFTGEPWAEIRNDGQMPFDIYHHSRLVQLTCGLVKSGKLRKSEVVHVATAPMVALDIDHFQQSKKR